MAKIITFQEAVKATADTNRALLVGNGFSAEYFSYKTLLEKCGLDDEDAARSLFGTLQTVDFEVVIRALEEAAIVAKTYKKENLANSFLSDSDKVRRALVHAIRTIHPAHRSDIEQTIPKCLAFLLQFGSIFTLNYDLLLYWVILEDGKNFQDGFGLGEEQNGFRGPFKEAAHCNIYNLHGGLHLFRTADYEIEKRIMSDTGIIDAIADTITKQKRLPLYVAEGTSAAKLAHIYSTPYLRHCYGQLGDSAGNFFVFGHSANSNDAHIYDALFNSGIEHLYFCVHRPTAKVEVIDGELARYKKRNKSNIDYTFVDSETASVWK